MRLQHKKLKEERERFHLLLEMLTVTFRESVVYTL